MAFSKALIPGLAFALLLSMANTFSEAREFVVGGKNSWEIPSSPNQLNKWAEKLRFEIGDSIVLKYDAKTDSVLEVTEESYKACNISNPIKSYGDGNTKITLDKSGPFFFISGAEGHCEKGEKLEIRVLSAKHGHHTAAPAPSPSENLHHAPAPAPHNGGSGMKAGFIGCAAVVGFLVLF